MDKTIFIDRDGVINRDLLGYVERWEDFDFLPGSLDALRVLTEAGFTIIIISNQAGVGDGVFTKEALDGVNNQMIREIENAGGSVAGVYYCIHGKHAGCDCRKPKTGLFEQALKKNPDFQKEKTYFIGDKLSDIEAGKNFGFKTALVMTGYGRRERDLITDGNKPDIIAADLKEAVKSILS
ncbi:MAG: HAD family hydrolase [Candidatus Omnitrophica bacterium]|nr:HAD family hydrolase [Candidatus Omnitrophota bacterium]